MPMSEVYESNKLLSEYLLFHYAQDKEVLPADGGWPAGMREALDFAVRTVSHFGSEQVGRSLDLGCAVGRSSFELARHSDEVLGLDFSSYPSYLSARPVPLNRLYNRNGMTHVADG